MVSKSVRKELFSRGLKERSLNGSLATRQSGEAIGKTRRRGGPNSLKVRRKRE